MGAGDADSRILVGVDGSEDGLRAVLYAMREARARGGSLWLVHVVDLRSMSTGLWGLVADQQDLERAGQAALQDARDLLTRENFPVERVHSEVVLGDPLVELPRLSAQARLAVTGRRAISGLERMFVGSTSVALVTNGQCPLIVISSASTPRETGRLRVVAVAVNAWPPHGSALEWGAGEAGLRQARLRVVHVLPASHRAQAGELAATAAELDAQLAPMRSGHPDLAIEAEVVTGNPIDELVELSRVVDLLIVGLGPAGTPVSGLTRGLLAHASCPVGLCR